jgi:hypothetical protein
MQSVHPNNNLVVVVVAAAAAHHRQMMLPSSWGYHSVDRQYRHILEG